MGTAVPLWLANLSADQLVVVDHCWLTISHRRRIEERSLRKNLHGLKNVLGSVPAETDWGERNGCGGPGHLPYVYLEVGIQSQFYLLETTIGGEGENPIT